jgi:uncharacterized protein (DUF1499 family)
LDQQIGAQCLCELGQIMSWSLRSVEQKPSTQGCNPIRRKILILGLLTLLPGCSLDVKTSETIDLRNIERSHSPNDALACPPRLCRAKADFESPIFKITRTELINQARKLIIAEPRTKLIGSSSTLDQLVFVQRSQLFGFPDTIWIQGSGVDLSASLIIYSRSNYGYWDLGVNRERIRTWLDKLEKTANP